jgi:hypothetical protein
MFGQRDIDMFKEIWEGFWEGIRTGPRKYFEPFVWVWRRIFPRHIADFTFVDVAEFSIRQQEPIIKTSEHRFELAEQR